MPLVLVPVLAAVVILGHLAHTRIVLDAAAAAGARQAAVIGADGAIGPQPDHRRAAPTAGSIPGRSGSR